MALSTVSFSSPSARDSASHCLSQGPSQEHPLKPHQEPAEPAQATEAKAPFPGQGPPAAHTSVSLAPALPLAWAPGWAPVARDRSAGPPAPRPGSPRYPSFPWGFIKNNSVL